MSQKNDVTVLLHPRSGTCHRCGWDGRVGRLPRRTVGSRSPAQKFGRVCAECANDLIQPVIPPDPTERAPVVRTGSA